jgi:hypothetical protein
MMTMRRLTFCFGERKLRWIESPQCVEDFDTAGDPPDISSVQGGQLP